jgi:hypothetical protein
MFNLSGRVSSVTLIRFPFHAAACNLGSSFSLTAYISGKLKSPVLFDFLLVDGDANAPFNARKIPDIVFFFFSRFRIYLYVLSRSLSLFVLLFGETTK